MGRDQNRSHAAQLLARLWTNPATVAYLIEQGHLDRFRTWFDQHQDTNTRRQLIQLWLHREEAQASLADRQVAQWLVELLAEETEGGFRRSYAISLLGNSRIRQHLVANGASDFLAAALGERGQHARSAVGTASLPLNAAVEVEAMFEIA